MWNFQGQTTEQGKQKGGSDRRGKYQDSHVITLRTDGKKKKKCVRILFKVTKATTRDKNSEMTVYKMGEEMS